MQTRDTVKGLHNFPEFSQPLSCLDEAMEKKKTSLLLYKIFSKLCSHRKHHNNVYIFSSKPTYQPMRALMVVQSFYKSQYNIPVSLFVHAL